LAECVDTNSRWSLSLRQLETIVDIPSDDLGFAIWYLKHRGFLMSDDKSCTQITTEGMEYLEGHLPAYADIAPFLRQQPVVP